MKKYKIIANPAAGGGAGKRAIPQVEHLLTKYRLDYDIVHTERPWHGAELAEEAALADYDVVVAAGGDGTANEVINGLMAAKLAGRNPSAMGVLSVGRGNDFAHGVAIPYDLEHACRVAHALARRRGLLRTGEAAWRVRQWQERLGRLA